MTCVNPDIAVETRRKCYDNPAYSDIKTQNDSSGSTKENKRNATVSGAKEKTNSRSSIFQCRYAITLYGFFIYFQIDCYRIATSMSLVDMVNSTAINLEKNSTSIVDSCPLNNSASKEIIETSARGEFNWSPEIQGYILSAGFLGYVFSQIPAGMFAEAYGPKIAMLIGLLVSSLAHILCPFAAWYDCYLLIVMQLLRGVGQGFLPPANSMITARWFPRQERGFLNSLIFMGFGVGSFITYVTCGALCDSTFLDGWPLVYFVYGGLGLVFGLCVHLFLYESPKEHPRIEETELNYILENQECDLSQKRPPTPWKKILTSVPVYVMIYSIFSHYWVTTQQVSEHSNFLGNILHFPIKMNGTLNSIPFVFQTLLMFSGGWISKWLNTHGYIGVDKARKACTILYSLGCSLALLGLYFAGCDRVWSNVCSTVAFSLIGLSIPGCVIVPYDMSPTFAGSLQAFSNTIASSASFIYPLVVGAMIGEEESLEQWNKIFLLCIVVLMSSGILFCLFGSAEIQPWNFPPNEDVEKNRPQDQFVRNQIKETTLTKMFSVNS